MSNCLYKRLGVGLVGLALPLMLAAPVSAQAPHPEVVSNVALECIVGLGIEISPCAFAVREGVNDVVEVDVNADLAALGVDYVVDIGEPVGDEPGDLGYDIQDIAVNPLPPSVTEGNPPVPGIVYP